MSTFIHWPCALLSLLCLALLFDQSLATASNRTIDDVFGDSETHNLPVFLPGNLGVWKDQTCGDCSINPDKLLAYNNTYHSATYNPGLKSINVTMDFDGTAIYVFLILANNAGPDITTETNCVFKLDGAAVGSFRHVPSTSTAIAFNVLAFSKVDIPPGDHQFVIATEGLPTNSYLNFDYAIYTHEDNITSTATLSGSAIPTTTQISTTASASRPQSNSHEVPVSAIAGGVAGGVACLAAIGACLFFNCFRRHRYIKRINLLGDPDDDFPNTTTNRRRPPPLLLSQSDTINAFPSTGAPSSSSAWPTQTSEIPHSPHLPSENRSPYIPRSFYTLPTTNTALVVSSPDRQDSTETQQAELQRRVTLMKGKIKNLKANLMAQTGSTAELQGVERAALSSDGARATVNVKALQAQIRRLTEEVAFLQAQQLSPWLRGPNREPPPSYTLDRRDDEWALRSTNVRSR